MLHDGGSQAEAWTPVEILARFRRSATTVDRTRIWDDELACAPNMTSVEEMAADSDKANAAGGDRVLLPLVLILCANIRIASSIYDGNDRTANYVLYSRRDLVSGEIERSPRATVWNSLTHMIQRGASGETGIFPSASCSSKLSWIQNPNRRTSLEYLREAQRRTALNVPNTGLIVDDRTLAGPRHSS